LNAKELNRLYGPNGIKKGEGGIWSFALHLDNMYTILNKNARVAGPLIGVSAKMLIAFGVYIPAEKRAYTSIYCLASDRVTSEMSGEYFVPLGKLGKASRLTRNARLAEKL
jgi:hypothetical protein